MNFIVLGHTGFIGAPLFARLVNEGYKVFGLNSTQILLGDQYKINIKMRSESNIFEEIKNYITNETIVVNCIWGDLTYEKRNSNSHQYYLDLELDLINYLRATDFKSYVSFGTIYEIYPSESASSATSKYVMCKKQIKTYLEESDVPFSWIRLASVYGQNDSKSRIIFQMLNDKIKGIDTGLLFPHQVMNIYHIDNFLNTFIKFLLDQRFGAFTAISSSWVELIAIKNAIREMEEPVEVSKFPIHGELGSEQVIRVDPSSFLSFIREFEARQSSTPVRH